MAGRGTGSTAEEVFSGSPRGLALFRAVERLLETLGPAAVPADVHVRATTSQIAFRTRHGFAYAWWPGRYVRSTVPAVLSIALHERLDSPRFKSVMQVSPGVWMHHLELHSEEDLDAEVADWLRRARDEAG